MVQLKFYFDDQHEIDLGQSNDYEDIEEKNTKACVSEFNKIYKEEGVMYFDMIKDWYNKYYHTLFCDEDDEYFLKFRFKIEMIKIKRIVDDVIDLYNLNFYAQDLIDDKSLNPLERKERTKYVVNFINNRIGDSLTNDECYFKYAGYRFSKRGLESIIKVNDIIKIN